MNINTNTTFIHNSAGVYGGRIYAEDHTTVNMNENTTFIHNSAASGGEIYAHYHTTVNMKPLSYITQLPWTVVRSMHITIPL